MMVTSGFARVNGARLYFEVQGSGPALVLLTDGPENTDSHFGALAESFQVLRYDMRGSGNSTSISQEPFSHTEDLLELMDHLSLARAVLGEVTPGATIAGEFAEEFPERVVAVRSVESLLPAIPESVRSTR